MNKEEAPEIIYLYPYQAKDAEMQGANSDNLVEYLKAEYFKNSIDELEAKNTRTIDAYYEYKDFADKEIENAERKSAFYLVLSLCVIELTTILHAFAEIPSWLEIAQCVINFIFIVELLVVPYLIDKKLDVK